MVDLFKSKVDAVMLKTLLDAQKEAEQERKDKASERMGIYYDEWDDILEAILRGQFEKKNYNKIKFSRNTSQNTLKKVIDEISLVYKNAPVRTIMDEEKTTELYNDIMNDMGINIKMKDSNIFFNLLNDVILQPVWDDDNKKMKLNIHTPAVTSVIQDPNDPEKAIGVYYEVELIDSEFNTDKWYIFWNGESHFVIDKDGNEHPPTEDNQNMVNPYGVFPFVFIHKKKRPGSFWNPSSGNDIVNGTLINGINKTLKNYLMKWQSFKQPWMKTNNPDDLSKLNDMRSDPSSMWTIVGKDADIGVLNITADFKAIDDAIDADINGFLSTYGLSIDSFSSTEISGVALRLKNSTLKDIRLDQVEFFRKAEQDLFDIIRIIWNYHNKANQISEKAVFKIDYPELVFDEEPAEKRNILNQDLSKGIISIGQYAMALNPDIKSEEAGAKMIKENLAALKEIKDLQFNINDGLADKEAGEE